MKVIILVLLVLLSLAFAGEDQVLHPKNSDDILDHLEGNNYNIYLLFFAAATPYEEIAERNNKDIEEGLNKIITDNPEVFYARIDHTNQNFNKLIEITGVYQAPSVFLMNHGKGVWIYEGNSEMILSRLNDFLPEIKEAAGHQKDLF